MGYLNEKLKKKLEIIENIYEDILKTIHEATEEEN